MYGNSEVNSQPEDYWDNVDPRGLRACYDESKRYGESLVQTYRSQHDVDVPVAHIFKTYGPRMSVNDGRVVPTFIRQTLRGRDLTVYNDWSQTRSFCYVDGLIDGFNSLTDIQLETPVNLGNPDERMIQSLAELVIEVTNSESGITYEPLPPDNPKLRRPDISKARAHLDWQPETALRDGLERSLECFRTQV